MALEIPVLHWQNCPKLHAKLFFELPGASLSMRTLVWGSALITDQFFRLDLYSIHMYSCYNF